MNESALSNDPGTQKRRSTRIVQAVPLTVTGVEVSATMFTGATDKVTLPLLPPPFNPAPALTAVIFPAAAYVPVCIMSQFVPS